MKKDNKYITAEKINDSFKDQYWSIDGYLYYFKFKVMYSLGCYILDLKKKVTNRLVVSRIFSFSEIAQARFLTILIDSAKEGLIKKVKKYNNERETK